jgi:hypothetical protein
MRYQLAKTPETVIFLHIPKTAGTTLDQIIFRHYRHCNIYETGPVAQQGVIDFQNLTQTKREKYRLIKGHLSFGIHEYVSSPWVYFTFFRSPIERTISHFYFMLRSPEHPLHDLLYEENLDLKGVLEAGLNPMLHNAHTRLLSGVWAEPPAGTCDEKDLAKAKENLRQIKVIGLTEKFDVSLLLLGKAFGWNHLYYTKENVSVGRPTLDNLSEETIDAIQTANQLDIELYDYAKALFAEQVDQQGSEFAKEVWLFQFKNRYVRPLIDLYWEMRKVSVRTTIREKLAQKNSTE